MASALALKNKAAQDAYALKAKGSTSPVNTQPPIANTAEVTKQDYGFMGSSNTPTTNTIAPAATTIEPAVATTPATTPATTIVKPSLKETNLANQAAYAQKTQPTITTPIATTDTSVVPVETNTKLIARQQAFKDKKVGITTPTTVTNTTLTNPSLLTASESDVDKVKQSTLGTLTESAKANKTADRDRTLEAGKQNYESENKTIGLNDDGSIDTSRPNSIASRNQAFLDDFTKKQNELSSQYESSRRGMVSSQVRQGLASRGLSIEGLAPEALIALSDSVGANAFQDIYQNKQQTVNAILTEGKQTLAKLNALVEQGRISKEKYNNLVATTNSAYGNAIQDIQTKYANDVLGVADKAEARRDTQGTANANYISALKSLPDDVKQYLYTQYGSKARTLNTTDFINLVNKDPKVAAGIKQIQEASAAQASTKNALTQSVIQKNTAVADKAVADAQSNRIKAQKSGVKSITGKPTKLTGAQLALLGAAGAQGYTTFEQIDASPSKDAIYNILVKDTTQPQ